MSLGACFFSCFSARPHTHEANGGTAVQQWKLAGIGLALGLVLALGAIVPAIWMSHQPPRAPFVDKSTQHVRVNLLREHRIITLGLETYVRGVVAAEMPASFQLEALKAQAIASRTYIVRRLGTSATTTVTDGVQHQAFLTDAKLRRIWGTAAYTARMARIEQAVQATTGEILTYKGAPIDAAFFSTSNGYTENANEYWTTAVPYLRSVRSPWDREVSPKYVHTVRLSSRAFARALGLPTTALSHKTGRLGAPITYTTGRRVGALQLGGRTFAGRQIRERLRLASSSFTITRAASGTITITTHGYGHGIGMSQYGAEGMARKGYAAEAILTYYYRGVQLEKN